MSEKSHSMGMTVSLACIITNVYLYEEEDDDEARRGTKARSDDVTTAKCAVCKACCTDRCRAF